MTMQSVCVFCGSAVGSNPAYAAAARELGAELARRSLTLVYGGGRVGLMGELATAAVAQGGRVVGVIPVMLSRKEIAFAGAAELHVVDTMHTRKALMADRSDAFLALPGGFGTCDELFEILTWAQIGIHQKPIGLWNVAGFFDPLIHWLDHMVREGLVKPKHRDLVLIGDSMPELLDQLASWQPPTASEKWMTAEDR